MLKTSICIFPDNKGEIDSSFNFTKEYCRICLGVLGQDRHRVSVFCGKNEIFKRPMTINQFTKTDFIIDLTEKINGMIEGARSIFSDQQDNDRRCTFNVGRLIIICDPNGIKLPEPTKEQFLVLATEMLSILMGQIKNQVSSKRDRLYFELIIFSDSPNYSNIDESNELIHVTVRHPKEAENYAQSLAQNHLKLSYFKMKKFQIFFLNIFEQSKVVVTNVKYQNPEDLVGPVEVTYPCVILNKDIPVMDELQNNVIIFQDEWLLSLNNGLCFLSKIGQPFPNDVIQNFSFKVDVNKNRLIQEMPSKLIISPIGDNWRFTRTEASPAINSLTRISQFEDKNLVLFSPYFMTDKIRHQKAFYYLAPILSAIGKASPSQSDVDSATKSINELFQVIVNAPQEILEELVLHVCKPNDQVSYAKALDEKRTSLLMEIKIILGWYENASDAHRSILKAFLDVEQKVGPISYMQH